MAKRLTFSDLRIRKQQGRYLTPGQRRRLSAYQAAVTRSAKKFKVEELEQYEFSSLSESEQYRLRHHWSTKAKKEREIRELGRVLDLEVRPRRQRRKDKTWKKDFREFVTVLHELKTRLQETTGERWDIERTGPDEQQWIELVGPEGTTVHPELLGELMAQVDYDLLRKIPNVVGMAHYIHEEIDERGRTHFDPGWTQLAFTDQGDVTWSQSVGVLEDLSIPGAATITTSDITAISFTWY